MEKLKQDEEDGGFVVHQPSSDGDQERHTRASQFIDSFLAGIKEGSLGQTKIGFDILSQDSGLRQENGQECFWAAAVVAARALELAKEDFRPTVSSLHSQAEKLGLVDQYGLDIRHEDTISKLLTQLQFEAEFRKFFTQHITNNEIKQLGVDLAKVLTDKGAVIISIPSQKHFVLLHSITGSTAQIYDSFLGGERPLALKDLARMVGYISNDQSQGPMMFGNVLVFLKPQDFIIHTP